MFTKKIKQMSKIILACTIGLGAFYSMNVSQNTKVTAEQGVMSEKCGENSKKQRTQLYEMDKIAWYYSAISKTCYYSSTENGEYGVYKKDSEGKTSVFFKFDGETLKQPGIGLTIMSISETQQGDIIIGGNLWVPQSDAPIHGYFAILGADGKPKVEKEVGASSIENISVDEEKIALVGFLAEVDYEKGKINMTPYVMSTDFSGKELSKKEFTNMQGYFFSDVKLYKNKYFRVSSVEFSGGGSNTNKEIVKWLDSKTLMEVSEDKVNAEDQITYTKDGFIKYDGSKLTVYNTNGDKLKEISYTSSAKRVIPLPKQYENTFVIAEVGPTVVLKSIDDNGVKNEKTVDTKISISPTDKIDFRQNGKELLLHVISAKGEETLHPLETSSLKNEVSEKKNTKENTKNISNVTDNTFILIIIGGIVLLLIIVVSVYFIFKKNKTKKA